MRALLGGQALVLPSTYPLAVTTLAGVSPLVAGLVDESAPLVLGFAETGGSVGAAVALRLTSGAEFVVALSNGAEARYSATPFEDGRGTFLRPLSGKSEMTLGVSGDYLVLGASEAAVATLGPYLGRSVGPKLPPGPDLDLTAGRAALSSGLSGALRLAAAEERRRLEVADLESRARHGGRNPDFGEPAAVLEYLATSVDGAIACLEASDGAHLEGDLLAPVPRLRFELVPSSAGPAHELVSALPVGGAQALLDVPLWTRFAVLLRGGRAAALEGRLEAVLGNRLPVPGRRRLAAWAEDLGGGIGPTVAVGLYSSDEGPGLFLLSPAGDGAALGRATRALPELAALPGLSEPIEALWGKVRAAPSPMGLLPGTDSAGVAFRLPADRESGKGVGDRTFDVVSAARAGRGVVVMGAEARRKLPEVLSPVDNACLREEPGVRDVVMRAGDQVALAAAWRVEDAAGTSSWSVLSAGTDRRVAWIDFSVPPPALGVLARLWLSP